MEEVEWEGIKIPKEKADLIQSRIDAAKQAGQFAAYDQMKIDLKAKSGDLFADFDVQKGKLGDMLKVYETRIADMAKNQDPVKKATKDETPEMARARLEAEYDAKMKDGLKSMKISAALNEVKAAAIASKLDPDYADAFESMLAKHYPADVNGDTVIFRNGDLPLFAGDQPAKPADVAAILLKKYPKLVATATPGPDLGRGHVPPPSGLKLVNSSSKIAAGIGEAFPTR